MITLNATQQKILVIMLQKTSAQSSEVYAALQELKAIVSLVTVKRALSDLLKMKMLTAAGAGRSTGYSISASGRIFTDVPSKEYLAADPDNRYGLPGFNFELLPAIPKDIFTANETAVLEQATKEYKKRIANLPVAIQKKELERLVIELSWKSSKIEGNTYSLLDTEKLILEHKEAAGHSKQEAHMILNHKDAFDFVHKNHGKFKTLSKTNLESLHAILVKGLSVGTGLRKKPVGVTGSKYRPLDNVHQITDAVEALAEAVSKAKTPYAQALIALLGISYIQPFEDGNKRTSRLMANALLMAHGRAPLSYRSVNENEYREAMLVFYEVNSIVAFKKIFVGQYDFAARNYAVK